MSGWAYAPPLSRRVGPIAMFLVLMCASAALFVVGLWPGHLYELDYQMNAAERCPPSDPLSEQSYDGVCVSDLIARGPLYLGKEALAMSFVAGAIGILSLMRSSRPRSSRKKGAALAILYMAAWAGLLLWNAAEGARHVRNGIPLVS